jgi:hypothetical protein
LRCDVAGTRGECACFAVWRINVAECAEKPVAGLLGAFAGLSMRG